MLLASSMLFTAWLAAASQLLPTQPSVPSAETELQSRLAAASTAQQSGNPEAIAQANKRLIGLAVSQMADLRLLQGALSVSVELYKRSIEMEDSPATRMNLALAYLHAGRTDDSLRESARLVELDPKSAAAWNLQGKLWMMKKDYRQAADSLEKSLALQADGEVSFTLATAFLHLHQTQKAEAIFKEMQTASGDRADMHVMAGRAYESANLPDDAEREYKRAIALDAAASRGHYFLGLFYLTKNGWEVTPQARTEFLDEVSENPTDFFGNYFTGFILSGEKNYDESDRYLKVASAAKPDWPEPYLYMGLNAYGRNDNQESEQLLRKAIELTGKDQSRNNYQIRRAYFTLGRILVQAGKKKEGTDYLLRSKEIETKLVVNGRHQALDSRVTPNGSAPVVPTEPASSSAVPPLASVSDSSAPLDAAILKSLNLSDSDKQQVAAAEKQLRSILGNAYNDLGTSEARRRQYEPALAHFKEAKGWNPEVPNLMRNIGLAAFLSKNYAESARALAVVAEQDPSDQRSQSMLAMSLFSVKDYAGAAKVFERVPEAAASDPRMAYGWALSLARINDRQRASVVLEKLTAQSIPPEMLVLAGQLYTDIGDPSKAETCYKRAKEQDPSINLPQ